MGEINMEDILANPHKYGAPTFDEFSKNPDKYRITDNDILGCLSNGGTVLRKDVKEQIYYIGGKRVENKYVGGYKVKTLEKVDQIAADLGYALFDLDFKPELERTTGGKYIIHVYIVKKGGESEEKAEGLAVGGSREGA